MGLWGWEVMCMCNNKHLQSHCEWPLKTCTCTVRFLTLKLLCTWSCNMPVWLCFQGVRVSDEEHLRRYGDVVGLYEGRTPVLLVANTNMLKHILVTHFNHFHTRRVSVVVFLFFSNIMCNGKGIHSFAVGKLYHHSMFHNPTAAVNLFHVGKQYLTFCKA